MHPDKAMNHDTYQKSCRGMSDAELAYTVADCRATLDAWPDCPNSGYYQDEIHYAAAELARRARGGHRDARYIGFRHNPLIIE